MPLGVDFGVAAQREPVQAFVVPDVGKARLKRADERLFLRPLSRYLLAPPVKKGLVIGYAYVPTDAVSLGGRKLARLILEILAPGRVPNESHRKVIKSKAG